MLHIVLIHDRKTCCDYDRSMVCKMESMELHFSNFLIQEYLSKFEVFSGTHKILQFIHEFLFES